MTLHPQIRDKLEQIERVTIETQEPGVRIIDKTGPLANPADRDHCIQYMVAIPLLFGRLDAADYEDEVAARSARRCAARQDAGQGERGVHAATTTRRTSATSATPCRCSSRTAPRARASQVDYPIGHRKRRAEGMPVLVEKFEASVAAHFRRQAERESIKRCSRTAPRLRSMPVGDFVAQLVSAG